MSILDDDISLCDTCQNYCKDEDMIVDACSEYAPKQIKYEKEVVKDDVIEETI